MERSELRNIAYKRDSELNTENKEYADFLGFLIDRMIKDDLGEAGDVTTCLILENNNFMKARIISKSDGIISGTEEALELYKKFMINADVRIKDGECVKKGDTIIELSGKESDLLKTERIVLNIIQRMSGISTMARKLSERASPMGVCATRKTCWGLLDKKAVAIGGGFTHRLGLWDAILIKENHLFSLMAEGIDDAIPEALRRAWKHKNKVAFIEIEVKNRKEAIHAARSFQSLGTDEKCPRIIMLDNFSAEEARDTISQIKSGGVYRHILIEASGGITPENIHEYRNSGVDMASLGYLTHSARPLDISQIIVRE